MQRVNGKLVMMHGEEKGRVLTSSSLPYRGGIFGQPSLPLNRLGIFKTKWALPTEDMIDNSIGPGHNILPDRYVMESGLPTRGEIPKKLAGKQFPQVEGTIQGPRKDLQFASGLSGLGAVGSSLTIPIVGIGLVLGGILFMVLTKGRK